MIYIINPITKKLTAEQKIAILEKAAADKKAIDIKCLHMAELTCSTDYFLICNGNSPVQARAIADNIEEEGAKASLHFLHREGYSAGEWILLDYGECVVHIFTRESREFYNLETLWGDAKVTNYDDEKQ